MQLIHSRLHRSIPRPPVQTRSRSGPDPGPDPDPDPPRPPVQIPVQTRSRPGPDPQPPRLGGSPPGQTDMAPAVPADVAVSLSLLAGVVALSEVSRTLLSRAFARTGLCVYAAELVSTFQLCCCTHELKMLSEVGGIEPRLALTLTYVASVVHGLTFRGAIGNPAGVLEHAYHARLSGGCALRRIACQFAAAAAARAAAPLLWGVGLSELHARHERLGFRCVSPVRAPLYQAAAVELACAFAVQTVITHTRQVEEKYRVHAVAAVITTVVYAGGGVSGALFNPALAFSTQFRCAGPPLLGCCVVYWLGPLLGMSSSVLLSDKLLPAVWRTSSCTGVQVDGKKET